jgi:hypothetical protein
MLYLEVYTGSVYSRLGVKHSIFLKNGLVLSYETNIKIWKWKFKLYNYHNYIKRITEITKIQIVKPLEIESYNWIESKDICCFEALQNIYFETYWEMINPIKKRVKRVFTILILLWLFWLAMLLFWYYGFTMSEEEFLEYKQEICL